MAIGPWYNLDEYLKWIKGGASGNPPNGMRGGNTLEGTREYKVIFAAYAATSPNKLDNELIKAFWNKINTNTAYDSLNGTWFVKTFNISRDNTPYFYKIYPNISPEELWMGFEQDRKDRVIFEVLKATLLIERDVPRDKRDNAFQKIYSRTIFINEVEGENTNQKVPPFFTYKFSGAEFFGSELWRDNSGQDREIGIRKDFSIALKIRLNNLLFKGGNISEIDLYDTITSTDDQTTDIEPLERYRAEQLKNKLEQEHQNRTTLKLKEAVEKLGEDGDAKANAFFKNVEQCLLLSNVYGFSESRKKLRVQNITDSNVPYGGRIIPVDCEPNTSFMNYSSTTGEIYSYTKIIDSGIINAINYNFIVSNIAEVNTEKDGIREIEMPLLFGGQKNILSKNEEPEFKHVVLYGNGGKEESDANKLLKILGKSTDINTDIVYSNVEISFIGENQATAKTNVDVSLTLKMPNLTYLQAEFEGKTTYFNDQGEEKKYDYIYSPLDLITYLHRTSLRPAGSGEPINIKKYQGCARLYNPKFLKSYQRLVMKIIPTIDTTGLSDLQKQFVDLLEKYIEDNHLILDLALIDHTIKRSVKQEGGNVLDELKIEYKGYIRSKLQDPIFDCLRTKEQIKVLIKKEEDLISSLSARDLNNPTKKQDALDQIKNHNDSSIKSIKNHKKAFKQNLFDSIKGNKQIWTFEYNAMDVLDNNITKDFKIADSKTIVDAMNKVAPAQKLGIIDVESITKENLSTQDLDFVYFGDLVDVLMNNMYGGEKTRSKGITSSYEHMEDEHKTFPLKIVLPSFHPIEYDFDGETFKVSNKKMNLADFPIAVSWLDKWIDKNIVEPDVAFYSIGPLMHAIISSLVNGMLVDECYLNGSAEFLQFGLKSEFGLFKGNGFVDKDYKKQLNNSTMKNQNKTCLNEVLIHQKKSSAVAEMTQDHAPFFKKNPKLPMSQHCNFLVIYQQVAVFSNYKSLLNKPTILSNSGIPYFNLYSKTAQGTKSTLTKSIEFSKSTANYQRETRFELESLYSLAQLASVYNVTVATNTLLLDVFPGMIIFVDAGLYQDSSVVGSVAHTLGMGGFHLNEKVSHKAEIVLNKLNGVETSISANWIYSGAEEIAQETNEEQNDSKVPDEGQVEEEEQQESKEETEEEFPTSAAPEEELAEEETTNTSGITQVKSRQIDLEDSKRQYYRIKKNNIYYHLVKETKDDGDVLLARKITPDQWNNYYYLGSHDITNDETKQYAEILLKEAGFKQ